MRARPDGDTSPVLIFDIRTCTYQHVEIVKFARAVGVREEHVSAPRVPHPVYDGAAFASVLFERDDANQAWWNLSRVGWVWCVGPWNRFWGCVGGGGGGCLVVAGKREGGVGGAVGGAVGYDEDFPAVGWLGC